MAEVVTELAWKLGGTLSMDIAEMIAKFYTSLEENFEDCEEEDLLDDARLF